MAESSVPLELSPVQFPLDDDDSLADKTVYEAIGLFLASRKPFIGKRTHSDYLDYRKKLTEYFGSKKLRDIGRLDIRRMQQHLIATSGASHTNHLTGLLSQVLKRARLWEDAGRGFQPLPMRKDSPGRCITDEEEKLLLRTAILTKRWEQCYFFILLSLNTSMGPGECMNLRIRDIDMEKRQIYVSGDAAKNRYRVRNIPMNEIALNACREILDCAAKKGSTAPEHFVFPFRVLGNATSGKYDPNRSTTTFKTAWTEILKTAGLTRIRQYDLRHTCITRLCENPENSEETILAIAGHCNRDMLRKYSHVRVEARRAALAGLVPVRIVTLPSAPSADRDRSGRPLCNQDVADMIEVGLPPKVIASKIDKSPGVFDTSPESLRELKKAGVHDSIILAMVRAS